MLHSAMLHRIIVILSLIVGTTAWTIPAYMDLVYPKRWTTDIGDAYLVKDGEQQDGASNSVGSCLNKEVPKNVTRSLFPITGGNLRFAFVNESRGDGSSDDTGKFRIDMYFLAEPERTNPDFDDIVWMKRMEFWYGFTTGDECVVPMDMTTRLKDPGNQTAVDSLEGLNVTLTWQIRNIRNYKVFEQVDQCAYVTLTAKVDEDERKRAVNKEMCDRVNLDYFYSETTTASNPRPTDLDSGGERNLAGFVAIPLKHMHDLGHKIGVCSDTKLYLS